MSNYVYAINSIKVKYACSQFTVITIAICMYISQLVI